MKIVPSLLPDCMWKRRETHDLENATTNSRLHLTRTFALTYVFIKKKQFSV